MLAMMTVANDSSAAELHFNPAAPDFVRVLGCSLNPNADEFVPSITCKAAPADGKACITNLESYLMDDEYEGDNIDKWHDIGLRMSNTKLWDSLSDDSDSVCSDDMSELELESLASGGPMKEGSIQGSTSAGESSDSEPEDLSAPASPLLSPRGGCFESEMDKEVNEEEWRNICQRLSATLSLDGSDEDSFDEVDMIEWNHVCRSLAKAQFWEALRDEITVDVFDSDSAFSSDSEITKA